MHIRNVVFGLAALLISLSFAAPVSANVTELSNDPAHAAGPFKFYCDPYITPFISGESYTPSGWGVCLSLPSSITGSKLIAVYKGVPGASTFLSGDGYIGNATLIQEDTTNFGTPNHGDDHYGVVWGLTAFGGTNDALGQYFATGSALPAGAVEGQNYFVLPWKWAVPPPPADENGPVITIHSPQNGLTYLTTETVNVNVTIVDLEESGVDAVTYTLNGSPVDPNAPLPLASTPLGTATFVVTATDGFGNLGSATSTFTVADVPPVDVCPLVDGVQTSGPCADTLCVSPATWSVADQMCVTPPPPSDTGAPVVSIVSPQHGATYLKTDTVGISVSINDPEGSAITGTTYKLNGSAVNPALPLPLSSLAVGVSVLVVSATDEFGNTGYATSSFSVASPYTFAGFQEPINNTGHQISANTSVFKAGSTVPVKIKFTNASGQSIEVAGGVPWITPVRGPAMSAPVSEPTYSEQPSSGNSYVWQGDMYKYNWKTNKSDSGYWYYLYVVVDGQVYHTIIGLR